jgi:hypothetical protein
MASLNQLVSEFAHAVGNPNSIPLRRNLRYAILHGRNELIRRSYENHKYVDKGLQQRIRVSIINVPDGDLYNSQTLGLPAIKRTKQEVPKPVRLTDNLPFQSVRTTGRAGIEIPFAKEASAKFYHYLAGMCNLPVYDYINGYIYFFSNNKDWFQNLGAIIIESPFEIPYLVPTEVVEKAKDVNYDPIDEAKYDEDEFLIPEDMIGPLKEIVFKRNLVEVPRQTNETPIDNLVTR